jgi:transcriptional regulator with XRE-family HTH domain
VSPLDGVPVSGVAFRFVEHTTASRVAANARAELARAGYSASELARQLGWSQSRTLRRLNGRIPFDVDELTELAAFLGVPLSALVTEPAVA